MSVHASKFSLPIKGVMRTRDLEAMGWTRVAIGAMVQRGQLMRLGRGLYAPSDYVPTEDSALAQVAIKHPQAVFCLLTALRLHGLTTQNPHQVWIAIDHKAKAPNMAYPPLRIIRSTGEALHEGIEQMTVDGAVQVAVTSLPKTLADCFKFRNKIGLDVALEALREAWNARRIPMDELYRCARICRVEKVMQPYLESLA